MAINDVSLTAGMRSNLLNLQNTVTLLERTQSRLSSGNKVNTAIDNPTSFFASQALNSRASVIDSLKDAMGQAIQTVQAADKGITAIQSMIEQAKGIAQSALSATASSGFVTETVTLNTVVLGDTITVGGTTLTAGPTAVVTSYDSFTVTLATALAGDTIEVGGVTYTASTGAGGTDFNMSGTDIADAGSLAAVIAANQPGAFVITNNGDGTLTFEAGTIGLTETTIQQDDATIVVSSSTSTSAGALGATEFAVTGDDVIDAQALSNLINATAIGTYTATASAGVITITDSAGDIEAADITVSSAARMAEALVPADSELLTLMNQYNEMRTQLSELAEDSGYKGKNLLSSDTLTVKFEGNDLSVVGFDASAAGLGMTAATWTTGVAQTKIDADVVLLDAAMVELRSQSSALAGNLSVITVRQDFSTNMINTLTEGANKLTLADANEEGANMLMLQTRQSLSTTALSLSAQAAQSVLRLFQ